MTTAAGSTQVNQGYCASKLDSLKTLQQSYSDLTRDARSEVQGIDLEEIRSNAESMLSTGGEQQLRQIQESLKSYSRADNNVLDGVVEHAKSLLLTMKNKARLMQDEIASVLQAA